MKFAFIKSFVYRHKDILYDYPLWVAGHLISLFVISLFWIVSPFVRIKVGALTAQRIGHLALNTDLFFRRRQFYGAPPKTRYIFVAGSVANNQLFTMWKRHMFIIENRLLRGLLLYSESFWKKTGFYEDILIIGNEYDEYQTTQPTIYFTPDEEERGRSNLKQMGIDPNKDWFICLFARDPEYMKKAFGGGMFNKNDWSHHDFRNADISTFKLAIDTLVEHGGFVVRMGHHVRQPLDYKHERVIDYAVKCRSDFMDIYLAAKCRFFLGTSSGICDVPMIFNTPRIMTNAIPPIHSPNGKNCLFIPKKIRIYKTGEYLPYATYMAQTVKKMSSILWSTQEFHKAGYEYENNTPEEIRDVTIEMMERVKGTFRQTEEDKMLLENYFRLFPHGHWLAHVRTPMGRDFLRKNWHLFVQPSKGRGSLLNMKETV